jgi:cytochrome c oxidase subunit 3
MAVALLPGEAPAAPVARPRVALIGTAFAAAASALGILGVLGIYLAQRGAVLAEGGTWLPEGTVIPLTQPTMALFTLLMSSALVQWAVDAIGRNDRVHTYLAIGLTFLLGFATVNLMYFFYNKMALPAETSQAVLLYTVSGAHLVMLLAAMTYLAVISFRALGGQFTSRQHDGISAAALYWHTMVALYALIWISIFVTK